MPDGLEHLVDLAPARRLVADLPDVEALGDDVARPCRRGFSDEIGSWKIICIRGRTLRSSSPASVVSSLPVELRRCPTSVGGSCMIGPPGRRLAAARLADEPERLAFDDVEADVGRPR